MTIYFVMFFVFSLILVFKTYVNMNAEDNLIANENLLYRSIDFLIYLAIVVVLYYIYIRRADTVGVDYGMYHGFMYESSEHLQSLGIEKGYLLLYDVARTKNNFLIVGSVSFALLIFGLQHFSKSVRVSSVTFISLFVVTYIYCISFNTIRQMAAIGIVFWGLGYFYKHVTNNNKVLSKMFLEHYAIYLIFVLAGSLFHSSAYFAAFIPITLKLKLSPRIVIAGTLFIVSGYFSDFATKIIPKVSILFPHYVEKYTRTQGTFFAADEKGVAAFIPVLVQLMLVLAIVAWDSEFIKKRGTLVTGYFFYLLFYVGGGNVPIMRVQAYWLPFAIFFTGAYLEYGRRSNIFINRSVIKAALIGFWFVYGCIRILRNISGVVPYLLR